MLLFLHIARLIYFNFTLKAFLLSGWTPQDRGGGKFIYWKSGKHLNFEGWKFPYFEIMGILQKSRVNNRMFVSQDLRGNFPQEFLGDFSLKIREELWAYPIDVYIMSVSIWVTLSIKSTIVVITNLSSLKEADNFCTNEKTIITECSSFTFTDQVSK